MKQFYICSFTGHSGISKYAQVFYDLVLKPRGFIHIDSHDNLTSIFTRISSRDRVHIEIGIFQNKEMHILQLMLNANYRHVSITLHDAPILKYPLIHFNNSFLNNISKFYDRFIAGFQNGEPIINKIENIFILTKKGLSESMRIYKSNNFHFLPHIVNTRPDQPEKEKVNRNFLYLGFIGKNKGIEYALKLHSKIIKKYPDIQFYVVGSALGKQKEYYQYLKHKYTRNVHFMGYVHEEDLTEVYRKTKFALILFRDYKFFYPASGSILNCMKQGKIVLSNRVNAVAEIIEDGQNGIFLAGAAKEDFVKIDTLIQNSALQESISARAIEYLQREHSKTVVENRFFKDDRPVISADNFQRTIS